MMLSPNNRSVYTDALTPPAGYELDGAIVATFSLDLTTLLSVPLHLVLQATEDRNELMRDPIALYEALQRATERVCVFAQHGRMLVPKRAFALWFARANDYGSLRATGWRVSPQALGLAVRIERWGAGAISIDAGLKEPHCGPVLGCCIDTGWSPWRSQECKRRSHSLFFC